MTETYVRPTTDARREAFGSRLCPHCVAPVALDDAAQAVRCQACRLVIGSGRTITAREAATSGRTVGAAAGALSSRARREAEGAGGDPADTAAALRGVAHRLAIPVDRLRMLDYQCAWIADQRLPSLGQVMGAFGSWKTARAVAAEAAD